jgi:acetate CoA/acetoacetate CoA-transferase alpha subunit
MRPSDETGRLQSDWGVRAGAAPVKRKAIDVGEAADKIPDGATVMIGGFMGVGSPMRLIDELVRRKRQGLTVIANDTARPGVGIGKLISAGCVQALVTSHIGTNPETQQLMIEGRLAVTLVPQGTLAERIRAGGVGLGGVLTPTGVGTMVAEGGQIIELDGRPYLLERALKADFSLIRARRADYYGNLEYALTARNFNPLMAMASTATIAEAEDIVPVGVIPPDVVGTPGVLVHHLVGVERAR